jgi:hypothetical protein
VGLDPGEWVREQIARLDEDAKAACDDGDEKPA